MAINLLIRTYVVENLFTSLFSIPKVIDSENVHIYVHNDNPEVCRFNEIIKEFCLKYPDYSVIVIQEKENQDMFMSYINSIAYLEENNYWTMMLDDDDTICKCDIVDFLTKNQKKASIKYAIFEIFNGTKRSTFFEWHRIYPTKELKKIFENRDVIVTALLIYNKTTKFNKLEDELMYHIAKCLLSIDTIEYKQEVVNHNLYTHEINGYKSEDLYTTIDDLKKTINLRETIKNIIDYIYEHSAIHK